ncbi:MAG: Lrp/AsnC ligand binding domain-containing protein [Deltaproteobacteria bacterium]|jgi:DNA-binding Lrp family transcriptional regulator|nr:Lrp/AsnC ligand binding domain-containing protein [Deltaproteobacteria bacterium]MBT4090649.1 Lrp/AsnC ligand binding domain-containing protein [Deltaproteobacteria bacterium]MBT4262882.1 Lrp/AsnC ligand binding domain-containing protein [Deltaproteobacteria bacterium]MBT4643876.1 Lrp/AsnC ligand binding domain-containing protein [Deltaproteobacteria bacterium]MBT6499243.1 Lrp/AsnC ligand binding domain-containing protein [Deltaproteobacteria bacterium]
MLNSIILINAERTKINEVADKLASTDGISEVYSVAGKYDLIAIVRVKSNDDLANLVTNELSKFESITRTETLIAFRAISRHDLEAMFSFGFEEK